MMSTTTKQPTLAPHPDERDLRRAERELATTVKDMAAQASAALRNHDRIRAYLIFEHMEKMAEAGKRAMARAVQDQMTATRESGEHPPN